MKTVPADPNAPWYASVPVGRDTLKKKISPNVRTSKNQGNKTNHSLRATGVTELYESGIPEVIQDLGVN